MKAYFLVFLLLINQVAMACPEDVQEIQKGQVALCDGLLFSPEASKKADEALKDSKYYKDLTDRLYKRQGLVQEEVNILEKRLQLYMDQSHKLSQELTSKNNEDKWQKIVYFSLGVLATGIAVYGASQLSK